ncbi:MAG TPA: hypothetical protein VEP90_29285, partial [Methylomirabilota bacterium]|nr:hypothetical protein [Methylomirabilota bacterium]
MYSEHKNKRLVLKQRLVIVLLCIVLFVVLWGLVGCSLPLPSSQKTHSTDPGIAPIVSTYQPNRLVSVLVDTPPFFEASYFKAVLNAVADRTLELTNVCQGGFTVFVSFLGHDSVHTHVISITVPPLPCDPLMPLQQPTPDPAKFQSQYDYSDALDKVNTANGRLINSWQAILKNNHQLLASIRAQVKKASDALRAQPVI